MTVRKDNRGNCKPNTPKMRLTTVKGEPISVDHSTQSVSNT